MKVKTKGQINTAGWSHRDCLYFDVEPSSCGHIEDGISFQHDNTGWWLIKYKDLLKIVELARKVRNKQ